MGTKLKFTPRDLQRFQELGRGKGTYEQYIPWHRVSRADPSSKGRSHLTLWRGRQRELLSDQELVAFLFSTMLPEVVDIREQFPLNLHSCQHELNAYQLNAFNGTYAGTIKLADQLKIKHPIVREREASAPWIFTTDLLLTLRSSRGLRLLGVSVKPSNESIPARTRALLAIEREYWKCRDVPWILVTQELYSDLVADQLKGNSGRALVGEVSPLLTRWVLDRADEFHRRDLTYTLQRIAQFCGCLEEAKAAFWQAVWTGKLPIDLRRGWRPSLPLTLLSSQEFWDLNPVYARRTSWQA